MRPSLFAALFTTFLAVAPAAAQTTVIKPSDMATSVADVVADPSKWFYFNDENNTIDNTLGSFVVGPGMPPLGTESVEISVFGTQRRNLATYRFSGVTLASLTQLGYSTYTPTAGNPGATTRAAYLQFNVDFNGSDTWQRRLVFLPMDNGAVVQDQWQAWDAIANGNAKWRYSGPTWPGTLISGSTPRTWSNILASYPGVRVRVTDSWLGIRVGEPYPNGYTTNLDAFVIGTNAGTAVFDFDFSNAPASKSECMQGGWQTLTRADGSSFPNQGQCIQYVNTGK
ncbi:MAG TPA: hypothetical protein VNT81_02730 [Vicinamibacterales bacterium]|nr:hypothetical protein [Vicinamibacterales bacterium]